jgi:tripartite-type tricarboxylate transporter receptor subunit TctC
MVLRRGFLGLAAGAAAAAMLSRSADAESYPSRPVRLVVPFPAGQASDTVARLVGQSLSERLGQPVVIENRTGGGGNIATEAVVRAAPDGDFIRDIAPVAGIGNSPYLMVVHPSVPARTVAEFITYAKANPGKMNMGSSGVGSVSHVFGELFKATVGIQMVHVPYRGGYVPDLVAGRVQMVFGTISSCIQHVRSGALRALAVTNATRSAELPDVPTIAEFVPGYEASQWYGVGAPKGTAAAVTERLNQEINTVVADPALKARFASLGVDLIPMTSTEFGRLITAETEKWGKVIQAADIKAD